MDIATAIAGVLQERSALQQNEGLLLPAYISEHMQALAQYTSALEELVGDEQKRLDILEAELFDKYTKKNNKSVNAAQTIIKYEMAVDRAEITRLTRLCSTSWRFISVAQSRHKHLMAEATNQV